MHRYGIKPLTIFLTLAVVFGTVYIFWPGFHDVSSSVGDGFSFGKQFHAEDDLLNFFDIPGRNGMFVTWGHALNSKDELEKALEDDSIMMLEGDVQRNGETPVMAHDPNDITAADISLKEWLIRATRDSKKGIKLDFKMTSVLEPSLQVLNAMKHKLHVPILLNADILKGPNSNATPVSATLFFSKVSSLFPHSILSVGWTTSYNVDRENEGYSQKMVEKMYKLCADVKQPVTFPVRASLTAQSISTLQWLIKKSSAFSLTVWHSGTEVVSLNDLIRIHQSFDRSQVFYDLPNNLMHNFKAAVNLKR